MKIKSLQINVLALLFGFAIVCFANKTEANNATKSPEGQQCFDQNGDDFSKQNQKTPKRGGAATTLNWTFRGPDDMSGKVTSIVSSASNHQIVYAGAAHNGVWKSTNGGAKWNKIPVENELNLYVTCLELDEASNVLYAGTGGDFRGQGVYKSEAGGSLKLMAGSENWTNVYEVAVTGNKVYAATSAGLWCSTNGGTWTICTGTRAGEPVDLDGPVRDLSINKSGLIIAAMNNVECYISKTGASDGFVYNELTEGIDMYSVDNISVTTSPTNDNVLYVVAVRAYTGEVEKALLSENKGDSWDIILSYYSSSYFIDPLESNGININNIYVDPVDPYTLYVASRNIWKGTRYASGPYDFGLSPITRDGEPASSPLYLHSNVRAIEFYAYDEGTSSRLAYVATDGGAYSIIMYIHLSDHFTITAPRHRSLVIGSYDYIGANNKGEFLLGSPTLGAQAIDTGTNYDISARSVWDLYDAAQLHITEGMGGPCAISLVNERYYAYSLFLNGSITFRRSIDNGYSFQPKRESSVPVDWFYTASSGMTPDARYNAPMLMWESFTDAETYDTVWFKADTITNYNAGDKVIYAASKNFGYPIEYVMDTPLDHGDSIQVLDPIQNRMFVGMSHKIWMTREALNYEKTYNADLEKTNPEMVIKWFQIATLDPRDTSYVFAVSDDANTLYIGTALGNVHCLTNLKGVYNDSTATLIQKTSHAFDKKIRAIAVDPTDENHVIVVLEGGGDNVYETNNGKSESATYNLVKENLPNNVYSALFPKGAPQGTVMLGTEKGIWMRESGSEWVANNNGIGAVPVMVLTQMTTYRPGLQHVLSYDWENSKKIRVNYPDNNKNYLTVYAATYGSGIFSTDQYVGIEEITPGTPKEYNALTVVPNPVKDIATIELDMAKGQATIQVFSIDGRCVKEQIAKSSTNVIDFKNYAPGTYIIYVIQGDVVKSAKVVKL